MRRLGFRLLFGMTLLGMPVCAQDIPVVDTDSLATDSSAIDSLNMDPDWYVSPEIPISLRAPKRANAASACDRVSAIQSYNIDNQLIEGTYYEYDNAGRVISTTVWTYNSDGSQVGKSKNEYGFDSYDNQVSTIVYNWDNTMNIWNGVSRYEFVYDAEQRMLSNTEYAWINYEWKADTKYTWAYDASGRETEYYEYVRNTTTNQLEYSKGRIQTWIDDTQKSQEIIYTAYSNGAWSAGTKKEWSFDAEGHQTLYAYYASISNGQWVGSEKETWTYTSGKLTLHEKFGWANNTWSKTLKEETEYEGANIVRIENYTYANGISTGTKKEEYTYTNGRKTQTLIYAWSNGAWVGSTNETWTYGGPSGQLTLHEKFTWTNSDWSKTLKEETEYSGSNIIRVENYTYANGVTTGTKKEEYGYTNNKKILSIIYTWDNGAWVGSEKETWTYSSANMTFHEKQVWDNGAWIGGEKETWGYTSNKKTSYEKLVWENGAYIKSLKENWAYSGNLKNLYEKYEGQNDTWVGVEKEAWGFTNNKETLHETYEWYNNDWSVNLREISGYDAAGNKNSIENYAGSEGVLTGTKKEEYTFNTAKEIIVTIKYKWLENVWEEDTKNEVGYREGNIEYSEANYTWENGTWVGKENKTVTEYIGDKVSVAWAYAWSSVASAWVYAARRICEYDNKGRNIGDTTYTYSNGAWEYYKLQTHGFDSHDNDTLAVTATWNGAEWMATFIAKGTYTYTPSGDPLLVETYTGLEGAWTGLQKKVWAYNDFGSQTLYYVYEWKSKKWANKEKREQSYDTNNHRLSDQSYTWRNNAWVGIDKYEYGYDEYGRQSMSANYIWSNNAWYGISKTENIMDQDGVLISSISYAWSNNKWEGTFKYDYVYDSYSRTIEKYISRYRNNQWSNYQHFVYTYDGIGAELLSSYEYMWKSSNWRLISMFAKQYEGTEHILREEENGSWDSSTGDLVSYSDNHYFYNCDPHFYTVRFVNYDGKVLANMTAQEGETPTYVGSNPTREGNAEYSYTFSGWNPTLGPVTSNVTYTATFTANKNIYTITWKNEDGTLIDQTTAEYGTMPTHEDASKANTAEYTYTSAGWTPGIGIVTGDAEYTATFTATKNKYLIAFKDEDGTTLKSEELEYGVTPTAPADPTKAATGGYLYTFSGWTPEIVSVTSEATYTATFTATKNKYLITFKDEDGSILKSEELEYGAMPTAPSNPTKASTAEDTYTFSGWDKEVVTVTEAATYTATYTATKNSYTITWLNDDLSQIDQTTVEYGVVPTHADPTKQATDAHSYSFAGWTPQITAVTGDETYTAQFSSEVNSYVITFMNGTDILQSSEVAYGETPVYAGAEPTKAADETYSYVFAGWDEEIAAVTGAKTYTAQFSSTVNKYTIKFMNGETELQSSEVEFGTIPTYEGAVPTKDATAQYTYTFTGWDKEIASVTGNETYTAQFSITVNSYIVTWIDDNDIEISHETLEYGATPSHADASKDNTAEWTYSFTGWTPAITSVTGNATYTATFSQTKNTYVITFLNYDGTELQTGDVEYGVVPTYTSATPTKPADAQGTYTFAGWDEEIAAVTGAKTYTATFTGVKGTYTITFYFGDGVTILEQMELAYGEMPEMTLEPARLSDPEFSYTFAGWEPAIAPVTADADYVAVYTATTNSYTIIFCNDDGTELQRDVLEYGILPIYAGEEPTKEEDERYTYEFAGWKPAVDIAKADAVYTATYTATKKKKQGIEDVVEAGTSATKIYIEGNIYILRAGHAYAPDGTKLY